LLCGKNGVIATPFCRPTTPNTPSLSLEAAAANL